MPKTPESLPERQDIATRFGVNADDVTINRWRPDTCGCVIHQWFLDSEAEPKTVHYSRLTATCSEHDDALALIDHGRGEQMWSAIGAENFRKNRALAVFANIANGGDLEGVRDRISWEFTTTRLPDGDQRALTVTVSGLTVNQANQIQGFVDTQFGAGAVSVVRA